MSGWDGLQGAGPWELWNSDKGPRAHLQGKQGKTFTASLLLTFSGTCRGNRIAVQPASD